MEHTADQTTIAARARERTHITFIIAAGSGALPATKMGALSTRAARQNCNRDSLCLHAPRVMPFRADLFGPGPRGSRQLHVHWLRAAICVAVQLHFFSHSSRKFAEIKFSSDTLTKFENQRLLKNLLRSKSWLFLFRRNLKKLWKLFYWIDLFLSSVKFV